MTALAMIEKPMESENKGDIGAEMARLRMGFGLSQQDVSNRLHIRVRYIQAMEENKLDLLPGKVYARGYLHTYAEFLGLDPAKTVEKCLGNVADAPAPSKAPAHQSTWEKRPSASTGGVWKVLILVAVLIGLAVVAMRTSLHSAPVGEEAPAQTSAVPESMLQYVRSMPMLTAWNYDCLTGQGALACFYTDPLVGAWVHPEIFSGLAYVGEIDLSTAVEALLPEVAPVPETPPAAEKTDAPPVEDVAPAAPQAKNLGALEPAAGVAEVKKIAAKASTMVDKAESPVVHTKEMVRSKPETKAKPTPKPAAKSEPLTKPFPPPGYLDKPTPSVFDEVDHNAIENPL